MRLPMQSAHVRGDSLFTSRAVRNDRWTTVVPQQKGAVVIKNRPAQFYVRPFPGCQDCICHVGGDDVVGELACPCCFIIKWW